MAKKTNSVNALLNDPDAIRICLALRNSAQVLKGLTGVLMDEPVTPERVAGFIGACNIVESMERIGQGDEVADDNFFHWTNEEVAADVEKILGGEKPRISLLASSWIPVFDWKGGVSPAERIEAALEEFGIRGKPGLPLDHLAVTANLFSYMCACLLNDAEEDRSLTRGEFIAEFMNLWHFLNNFLLWSRQLEAPINELPDGPVKTGLNKLIAYIDIFNDAQGSLIAGMGMR